MTAPAPRRYRFDDFEVDLKTARLLRAGSSVAVEPRAFRVLVYLIENRDRLVGKTEILDAVWEEAFVTENALTQAIARLRKVLGDEVREPRYIETAHTLGYRFLAEVKTLEDERSSAGAGIGQPGLATSGLEAQQAPAEAVESRSWVTWPKPVKRVAGGIVALLAVVAAAYGLWRLLTPPPSEAPAERPRIVVLPFENLGPPEDEYFAGGMTEEIISRLAGVSGLTVISRTSAMQYKQNRPPLKQIGEELRVGYVLEGTVRWAKETEGSRVRITPQLIQVADGTHVWSERYDRELRRIFEIQSEIAHRIVTELRVTLREPERRFLDARPTENLQAYQAYLRAKEMADTSLEPRPIQLLEEAVRLDPGFVRAWSQLVQWQVARYLYAPDPQGNHLAKAKAALDRVQELAPDDPFSRQAAGWYYVGLGEYERALEEFTASAEALPNDADARIGLAHGLLFTGRFAEALAEAQMLLELEPTNSYYLFLVGATYVTLRRWEEADRSWQRWIALFPDEAPPYAYRVQNLVLWKGRTEEARVVLEAAPETLEAALSWEWCRLDWMDRDFENALARLDSVTQDPLREVLTRLMEGLTLQRLDQQESARAAFESARSTVEGLLEGSPQHPVLHRVLGTAQAFLGAKEDAIREGRRAVELSAKNAWQGPFAKYWLAVTYALVGEEDAAIDLLGELLSLPYMLPISVPLLRLDPMWDPLRDHPRFQELLEKHEQEAE
jgi:TolB-like protein/DNA-binding winged helix-turn-helix (wHTH) protein/Flp pilus assembly protein TadD